jgi:iron complex outermembrane receptor protein
LNYEPVSGTTFKAIYGTAFRAPNAYESDYVAPGYEGNHSLGPEKITSAKLVLEQRLDRQYRVTIAGFYDHLQDLISQREDLLTGDFQFVNTDDVISRGFDAELVGAWEGGWRARASYTFAETHDQGTERRLSNSPEHLAKFNLVAPLWKEKVFAGVEAQWMSSRDTIAGSKVPAHIVCNVTLLAGEIVRNVEFSASIYNLFDERYRDPVSADFVQDRIEQPGRTFRVKLSYRF